MNTTTVSPFAGRLRISAGVEAKLRSYHLSAGKDRESFSYALGHAYRDAEGQLTITIADADNVLLFAQDCFLSAGYGHVTLDMRIKAQVFHRAVDGGFTAIVDFHDHHFAEAAYFSRTDDRDDVANATYCAETVQAFMPAAKKLFVAAGLISRGCWAARVVEFDGSGKAGFAALRIDLIGERFKCLSALAAPEHDERLSRHAGLITGAEQQVIRHSHVVVVGGGGTGSIAVESLLRLGFGQVTVIDADRIEASNLNRLQGAGVADVGRLKVEMHVDQACRVAPQVRFRGVAESCFSEPARSALETADLVLGCVDNAETRWWLNQFSVQYMVPWFDCAVALYTEHGVRHEGRTNAVLPAVSACGHCSPVEFFERKLPARFMDRGSLLVQRAAGYVANAPEEVSPSAYLVNQQAVAAMLQEVLNWFCGWKPTALSVYWRSDVNLVERIDSTVTCVRPVPGCGVCGIDTGKCREGRLPCEDAEVDLSSAGQSLRASVCAS